MTEIITVEYIICSMYNGNQNFPFEPSISCYTMCNQNLIRFDIDSFYYLKDGKTLHSTHRKIFISKILQRVFKKSRARNTEEYLKHVELVFESFSKMLDVCTNLLTQALDFPYSHMFITFHRFE